MPVHQYCIETEITMTVDGAPHIVTAYATLPLAISDEGGGFEEILDPKTPEGFRQTCLNMIRYVATRELLTEVQPITAHRLRRLHRIIGTELSPTEHGTLQCKLLLQPVCDFDDRGQPIPPQR
ncbi:hypothetical protein HYV74_03170 [Candidatus Uhrbacteria bacterium]|nr:hypothetical protein [Candidatus Uhrbacteria bacterium]